MTRLVLLVALIAACVDHEETDTTSAAVDAPIALPIEVLGPAGTTKTVTFTLTAAAASGVNMLELQCHGCGYYDQARNMSNKVKATVIVNGVPTPLKHFTYITNRATDAKETVTEPNVSVREPDGKFGGIGGGQKTVRIRVAVDNIVEGTNRIAFEHTDPDVVSIGFRILSMNLYAPGSGAGRLSATRFVEDDPATWRPILNDADSRARGRVLWQRRNSLYDPYADSLDGTVQGPRPRVAGDTNPLAGRITASCA